MLIIKVDDFNAAMNVLKIKGVELLHDGSQQAAVGIYAAFRNSFGSYINGWKYTDPEDKKVHIR